MTFLWLILFLLLEIPKRIFSPLLYPLAYALRGSIRGKVALWEPYLYKPVFWPLWLFLDDSLMFSQGREYDEKESRYPGWIWRSDSPFLKAWWWAAVRNSCVNWNNWCTMKTGEYVRTVKHIGSDKNFYEVREFTGGDRFYCEFWIGDRRNQVGWIRRGRFEIDVMKRML